MIAVNVLKGQKIYFGHQSIGDNLLDGIRNCVKGEGDSVLRIKNLNGDERIYDTALYHSKIGKNGDPIGKIKAFKTLIFDGLGSEFNMAFMKLCF